MKRRRIRIGRISGSELGKSAVDTLAVRRNSEQQPEPVSIDS